MSGGLDFSLNMAQEIKRDSSCQVGRRWETRGRTLSKIDTHAVGVGRKCRSSGRSPWLEGESLIATERTAEPARERNWHAWTFLSNRRVG